MPGWSGESSRRSGNHERGNDEAPESTTTSSRRTRRGGRGKKTVRTIIKKVIFGGTASWKDEYLTTLDDLARVFQPDAITEVLKEVSEHREYVAEKVSTRKIDEDSEDPKKSKPKSVDKEKKSKGARLKTFAAETYNCQYLGGDDGLYSILKELNPTMVGIPGTRRIADSEYQYAVTKK